MYQTTADLYQTHLELDSVWGPDLCPDALRILAEIAAATDDIEAARTMLVHALGTCKGDAQSWARLTYAIFGNLLRSHREKESLELLTLMIDKYSNVLNQIDSPIPKPPLIPVLARLLQKKAEIL